MYLLRAALKTTVLQWRGRDILPPGHSESKSDYGKLRHPLNSWKDILSKKNLRAGDLVLPSYYQLWSQVITRRTGTSKLGCLGTPKPVFKHLGHYDLVFPGSSLGGSLLFHSVTEACYFRLFSMSIYISQFVSHQ